MSLTSNRLLLSTCLSVVTLSAFGTFATHSYAGFEWNPPEQIIEEPVMQDTHNHGHVAPPEQPAAIPAVIEEMIEAEPLAPADVPVVIMPNEPEVIAKDVKEITPTPSTQEPLDIQPMDTIKSDNAVQSLENKGQALTALPEEEPVSLVEMPTEPVDTDRATSAKTTDAQEETKETSLKIEPYPLETLEEPMPENITQAAQKTKPQIEAITWNDAETFEVIEGFGTDMPLALALRQIVPAHYAFSFGNGVNPGTQVSWTGGKAWNIILEETLSTANINVAIKDNIIVLKPGTVTKAAIIHDSIVTEETDIIKSDIITSQDTPPSATTAIIDTNTESKSSAISDILDDIVKEDIVTQESKIEPPLNDVEIIPEDEIELIEETKDITVEKTDIAVNKRHTIIDPGMIESQQVVDLESIDETLEESVISPLPDISTLEKEEINVVSEHTEILPESLQPAIVKETASETTPLIDNKTPSMNAIIIWNAKKGQDLKKILKLWSEQQNVAFSWNTSESYKIDSNIIINGTLENALKVLFTKGLKKPPSYDFIIENGGARLTVNEE